MVSEEERYKYSFIEDLITDDVESISAFRAYFILEYNEGFLNEKNTIPFITTPIYPALLFCYLLLKRSKWLFRQVIGQDKPRLEGHVLMLTSTATYRFRPLILVARELPKPVTLLCTQSTKNKVQREDSVGDAYNVVSHNDLHGLVSIQSALWALFKTWQINRRVADRLEVENVRSRWIGYNLVLTELIKSNSVNTAKSGLESFHTQSASPYAIGNIDCNKLFLYQHGQSISMTDRIAAADCNLTYFTFGPGWKPEEYCSPEAIETINFVPIGNPLYDELLNQRDERTESLQYDVLLFSQSHVLSKWGDYERFVNEIIAVCEANDYRLAIKLHRPQEDASYYEVRGLDEYIIEDSIKEAILKSRVSISDSSSAFLESVILGSPSVVSQLIYELSEQWLPNQLSEVYQPDRIDDIEHTLKEASNNYPVSVESLKQSGVFNLGGSAERIARYVTEEAPDQSLSKS